MPIDSIYSSQALAMPFFAPDQKVPEILETHELLLVPLGPEHVQIDYDAVMSSREMLRLWSGSPWPAEDFTLSENLADLEWHAREHRERAAFTFTVLRPEQDQCLGCVYIRPLSDLLEANPAELPGIKEDEAMVRFWVRRALVEGGFDRLLLKALLDWFRSSWPFSKIYFHTRSANRQQILLFEAAKLLRKWSLLYEQRGGTHLFYRG